MPSNVAETNTEATKPEDSAARGDAGFKREKIDTDKDSAGPTGTSEAGAAEQGIDPADRGDDPDEVQDKVATTKTAGGAILAGTGAKPVEDDVVQSETPETSPVDGGTSPAENQETETADSDEIPAEGDQEIPTEGDTGPAENGAGKAAASVARPPETEEIGTTTKDDTAPAEIPLAGAAGGAILAAATDGQQSETGPVPEEGEAAQKAAGLDAEGTDLDAERKKRRRLLVALLVLLLLLVCACVTFWRYLQKPVPLPDLLPMPAGVNYAPHYLFSFYGVDEPVGVALSPQGDRIYVTETGAERLVKIFDRDGQPLGSLAPPRTTMAERSPVYLAVDGSGRVFVTDRLQHAVFVYDLDGTYLDTILGPDLTLSEYVWSQVDRFQPGTAFAYDLFEAAVYYHEPGGTEQILPAPDPVAWAPLGVRIDSAGNLLLTDVSGNRHAIHQIASEALLASSWQDSDLIESTFGHYGQNNDELSFPNTAVVDSLDRIYVADGNNGRISVWDRSGEFLYNFGRGAGEEAISLPRGIAMDERDRLHVVDSVGQSIKVYDVSEDEPRFLFAFGEWGIDDGQFNFPNDIALDSTGRLYIADRENNRIQVWSY